MICPVNLFESKKDRQLSADGVDLAQIFPRKSSYVLSIFSFIVR